MGNHPIKHIHILAQGMIRNIKSQQVFLPVQVLPLIYIIISFIQHDVVFHTGMRSKKAHLPAVYRLEVRRADRHDPINPA